MKHILNVYFILITSIILQGCNSIYFYDTQKYSLTIEGRPDATSPGSFSLGIKHRVAAVVPEKGFMLNRAEYKGEAVSLISYFNLLKKNNPAGFFDDPILVETALISGSAAASLAQEDMDKNTNKAAEVLQILSGADIGSYSVIADKLVKDIKTPDVLNRLKFLTMKRFNDLTFDDRTELVRITGLDRDIYTQAYHQALRNRLALGEN